QMCVTNTAACSAWVTYATSYAWTLPYLNGAHTVSVFFRDAWGNTTSSPATASISLDISPPVDGTITATPSSGQVALAWSGFSDTTTGVASYRLVESLGSAPASCATGTVLYSGTATTYSHTGLTNGTRYYYRVCAIDSAGNTSTGVATSATPAPEATPPV